MDIINLIGGLLYQWDTGRKVKIASPSCINVDEVHFTNDMQDALVVEPKSADNVYYAEIPNILLQDKRRIKVYVVTRTETGEQTVCCRGLTVNPRQKPADYIYTETELKRWESLDERIKALEEGGVGGSADAVLYTEQELTEEQKAVARENIGAVGAPQTAEVGQVISVKAVDDEGKPTEWECVDMSGETPRIEKTAEDVAVELEPGKLYVFPEMTELSLTFANPMDTTITNEYHVIFQSGETAATLTLPDTIKAPDNFTIEANRVYELSILEGCLTYQSWEVTAE